MLRAVVLTQYRRVTDGRRDGQTDGNAIASTALAMRALRRAVKSEACIQLIGPALQFIERRHYSQCRRCVDIALRQSYVAAEYMVTSTAHRCMLCV